MSFLRSSIVIDGNIGSGKTTQLKLLSKCGYEIHCEPINDWPLKLFYENKERWSFLLQMSILKSFMNKAKSGGVWERSPESSKEVFWKMLRDKGIGTDEEDTVYTYFYKENAWSPHVHIYIRTEPDECHHRILTRTQEGDKKISLDYLKEVHTYYESYIATKPDVKIIDGKKSPEEIHAEILECINDVPV